MAQLWWKCNGKTAIDDKSNIFKLTLDMSEEFNKKTEANPLLLQFIGAGDNAQVVASNCIKMRAMYSIFAEASWI